MHLYRDRDGLQAPPILVVRAAGKAAATRTVVIAALIVLIVRGGAETAGIRFVLNTTHSEPIGLYLATQADPPVIRRGMLVLFRVPLAYQSLVIQRGWLTNGVRLMKEIVALEGDRFCVNSDAISVNGRRFGPVFSIDSTGQPMPAIRGCYQIARGEFLPLSQAERSFDGRYIGPQPVSMISAVLIPIWTW
jgi:conjugative transfer signal peptidase TraF